MEAREMPEIRISGKRVPVEFGGQTRFLKTSFFIPTGEDESRSVHIDFPYSARVFKIHASDPHSISGEFSKSDFIALSYDEDGEDRPGLLGSLEPYWLIAVIPGGGNDFAAWEIGVSDKMRLEVGVRRVAWRDVQRLEPTLLAILTNISPEEVRTVAAQAANEPALPRELPKRPGDLQLPSFLSKKPA